MQVTVQGGWFRIDTDETALNLTYEEAQILCRLLQAQLNAEWDRRRMKAINE